MRGDNLNGEQPDIRYNVKIHTPEEWEEMTLFEKMDIIKPALKNWELDYLKDNKKNLSSQQIDILQGRELKSHEGMIYGQMYNDWKTKKGFNLI